MRYMPDARIRQPDRAAAGARYLDRVMPGWWRHVRIKPLDLASSCSCVLGQLAEIIVRRRGIRTGRRQKFSYEDATHALNLADEDAFSLGFVHLTNRAQKFETYGGLTYAWRNEIRARRNGRIR